MAESADDSEKVPQHAGPSGNEAQPETADDGTNLVNTLVLSVPQQIVLTLSCQEVDNDSAYGDDDGSSYVYHLSLLEDILRIISDTTSLASSLIRGNIENGRRQ